MNRKVLVILILSGLCIGAYALIRSNSGLKAYKISSTSSLPDLYPNKYIFVSEWVNCKVGNMVTFTFNDQTHIFRLVGKPGDTIEMKKGVLYRNHSFFDTDFNVSMSYTFSKDIWRTIKDSVSKFRDFRSHYTDETDKGVVNLSVTKAHQLGLTRYMNVAEPGEKNKNILKSYNQNWNTDNFGPIILPAKKYFVLGDNRHLAADSRYIGLIDESQLKGVVLFPNDINLVHEN